MARKHALAIVAGLACMAVVAAVAWDESHPLSTDALKSAQYVGQQTCAECHENEYQLWHGSNHDRAMEVATEETVLGDFDDFTFERFGVMTHFFRRDGKFFVNTEGPDGKYHDYEIKWTFGVAPLQQYMVEFPDGRVQVLRVAWDTRKKEWFEVTPPDAANERLLPDDPLHWTGIAQNWNTTCAECHSTDLKKNYDLASGTYHTTFAEIDVSCEECHGPGSVHVDLARRWSPFWDRNVGYGFVNLKSDDSRVLIETCAKCHSRRHMIHAGFRPGEPLLDYFEPALLTAELYHDDGQIKDEVYEYGSFMQSRMHAQRVRCTDCHEPHSLKLKFDGNQLCTQCHLPAKYDTPDHHHHPVESAGAKCIECHMPMRLYMVVDDRRDHSFRVPRPDLTVALGTPNACNDCHTKPNETPQWAADAVRKWYGERRWDDPHWAPAIAAGNRGLPEGEKLLAEVIERPTTPAIVRATAVSLIGQYPAPGIEGPLQKALADEDPLVRLAAVRALPWGEEPQVTLGRLGARLKDRSRAVRIAAAVRLAEVPREALPEQYRRPFDKALGEFRAAQELTLEHAHAHINLGWLDRQLGNPQRSADRFRTAIRLEPYLSGPRTELANLLAGWGGDAAEIARLRREEAKLLERDTKLLPNNADIFYRLGLLQFQLAEYAAAVAALEKACELAPTNYDYRMALALLEERRYELDGDVAHFAAAERSLNKLREMLPNDPRAGQILQRLMATRQQKSAAPQAP